MISIISIIVILCFVQLLRYIIFSSSHFHMRAFTRDAVGLIIVWYRSKLVWIFYIGFREGLIINHKVYELNDWGYYFITVGTQSNSSTILLSFHLNKEVPCYKHTVIIELDK